MYTELLGVALTELHLSDGELTTGERLAELLRCRNQLATNHSSHIGTGLASAGIADHLAYDVVLIELARQLGVHCDPVDFDQMQPARTRLEQNLIAHGIPLGRLEESSPLTPTEG